MLEDTKSRIQFYRERTYERFTESWFQQDALGHSRSSLLEDTLGIKEGALSSSSKATVSVLARHSKLHS